ncbi:MAG: hypothetical protein J7M25_03680 [Deltaproteobacteria bacterium]|nr:hypothetical protein [Deltaproteobacteria bacterium]
MQSFTRSIIITAAVFLLMPAACGPSPSGSNGTGDGGPEDASGLGDGHVPGDGDSDAYQCTNTCDTLDVLRCEGTSVQVCFEDEHGCHVWKIQQNCADTTQICDDSGNAPTCVTPETCDDGIQNQDESSTDCGGICPPCPVSFTCNDDSDCESGACTNGVCQVCKAGTFSCFGNTIRQCANDEGSWINGATCNPFPQNGATMCDATAGACVPIPITGNSPGNNNENVTGVYYKFAHFTNADGLLTSAYDVDSYQDLIYANRGGAHIDCYRITLLDSDGDGKLEPNQHPDNPDNLGPMEQRTLALVQTYDVTLGSGSISEIYATATKLYFPRNNQNGKIFEYDMGSGQVTTAVDGSDLSISELSYDDVDGVWYGSNEGARRIFAFDNDAGVWVPQFQYPEMYGSHLDGQEFVRDPNTGIGYEYVSDMTSDYIGQFTKDATGNWIQLNLFRYNDPNQEVVEGMGYGALNHFWAGAGSAIYELGGGDLSHYTDPTHQN